MATWFIENGIGEERAICVEGEHIVAAKVRWPGMLVPGQVEDAVLVSRAAGSSRGTARFGNGEDALVSGLPRDAVEGAPIRLQVTREAIGESGRLKRAQARPAAGADLESEPTLLKRLHRQGHTVKEVLQFPVPGWDEIIGMAESGAVEFTGGNLTISPTPAMTVIDIDGTVPAPQLAKAAVPAISVCLRLLDLGGSIAIDFPTLAEKADRRAVDSALAAALADWPHERTAMNGFGLVQLVAKLEGPSLLHRSSSDSVGSAARQLLRHAERVAEPGAVLEVTAHPRVIAAILPEWRDMLARRTGRTPQWHGNADLALGAGFAQAASA